MTAMPVKTDHTDAGQAQLTPKWLLDLLGPIALDPCTEPDNPTGATYGFHSQGLPRLVKYGAIFADGRRQPWRTAAGAGELIFVNPPFNDIPIWARKLATETKAARCRGALLVPTGRSDRMWFQIACHRATYLWLPNRRVHYWKPGRHRSSCPFPSCVFLFGQWGLESLMKLEAQGAILRLQCVERWT